MPTHEVAAFPALVRLETSKQLNTRSGRAVVVGCCLVVLAIYVVGALTGATQTTFANGLFVAAAPLGVVLPIIAILSVAGEWSTRSAHFTYLLEPRRVRVFVAQVLGSLTIAMGLWFLAVLAAALSTAVATVRGVSEGEFGAAGWSVITLCVLLLVNTLSGAAFAALLQNTPAAVVAFLALPTVGVVILGLVLGDHPVVGFVSLNDATTPLAEGRALRGIEWVRLGTACLLWICVPMVAGALRLIRRDAP